MERWSRGDSVLHRRHAAAKILVTLVLLIAIATLTTRMLPLGALYFLLLTIAVAAARLPMLRMLRGAAVVLPFAFCFAAISAVAGDPGRGAMLVLRGYLSAFAALLLIAITPMPELIAGLEWLRAPSFLLQVMQFLYRYLTVLMEEASAMRQASLARAGSMRSFRFRHAAAAAGVLFALSHARALAIHRAMLSRGFEGRMPAIRRGAFRPGDAGFTAIAAILIAGLRLAFR